MDDLSQLLEQAARVGTGPVSDSMEKLGLPRGVVTGMRLISDDPRRKIVGPAYTLRQATKSRTISHDENRTRQRFASAEFAQPGQVVLIDAGGRTDICTWGENQAMMAQSRSLAGLVAYGAVRDSEGIRATGFPVLCCGFSPVSSKWDLETVSMNEPVVIAGVQVRPGDLVYGDVDGLIVVPHEHSEAVLAGALEVHRGEERQRAELYD